MDIISPKQPPESFLHVDEHFYRHSFSRGRRGSYIWLKSNRFHSYDAFKIIRPPKGGYCVLSEANVDGNANGKLSRLNFSRVLHFDYDFVFGLTFVFPANMTEHGRCAIERDGAAIFSGQAQLDPVTNQKLWEFILRYRPIYAWRGEGDFWIATNRRTDMKSLVDDDRFQRAAEHHREFLRNERENFWRSAGREVGPDVCVEPHCKHLRIKLAVRCIEHQYLRFSIFG
jgi:hypothetical protein